MPARTVGINAMRSKGHVAGAVSMECAVEDNFTILPTDVMDRLEDQDTMHVFKSQVNEQH